jgi:hypothetical protein
MVHLEDVFQHSLMLPVNWIVNVTHVDMQHTKEHQPIQPDTKHT